MKYLFLLLILFSSFSVNAINVKTYIPPQAFKYLDYLNCECDRLIPGFPYPEYFAGLIEHESCISLKHSKCWNPKSRLKTRREEGGGLGQLTRAYRKDGTIRFDSLSAMVKQHNKELKELSWSNLYTRPDLQIKAIILMSRNNLKALYSIKDRYEKLAMADAAYNGGLRGLRRDRRLCKLSKDCNPDIWFNNVEKHCSKSKKPLYGNRSACDINRYHVKDILKVRMVKYKPYFRN